MRNDIGSATIGMSGVGGAAEKDEDDKNDEAEGDREGRLDIMERIHDRLRAIEGGNELDRAGQFASQLGQQRADRARDLDCIRAGLPRDGENNYRGGRTKIAGKEMPREAFVFDPVDDPGDVAEVDRRIVRPAGDDQVAIAFSVFESGPSAGA